MVTAGYSLGISKISIFLAGDDDILQSNFVKVKTHESFQAGEKPVPSGLYDTRMGAIASYFPCSTCGYNEKNCPGHFGYYDVNNIIAQPIVIEDFTKWIKIVCLKCGTLLIDINKIKNVPNSKKLQVAAQTQIVDKKCHVCGAIHPKVKSFEDNLFYINIQTKTELRTLYPKDIKSIFEKISDETCLIMGRSLNCHPRKYYTRYIPIPPICTRPYYKNIITNKSHRTSPTLDFLKNIIRKSNIKGNKEILEKNLLFLNKCNYDMIRGGSQKKGDTRTNNIIGGPLSDAIMKLLGGKKGLIRNFQMAHRALSGSRITISGNPTLEIDEVGIPLFVVKTLSISETVREWNIDLLNADILAGRCTRIKRISTGSEHTINDYNKNDIVLDYGDIIYRNIRKGDMCIFNRPPSLKESAIGSHRAVPFPFASENTFQTNVAVCVNYNADYDGDQMRLKVLRTLRAITESKYLTSINRWMLSSQNSLAVNGQVQDTVTGSALMTKNNIIFDKLHAMRTWAKTSLPPPVFDKKEYTGREIISLLLKDTPISYKNKAKFYNPSYKEYIPYKDDEINVIIDNGILKQGVLDGKAIGDNSSGGVFHLIALEYGTKIALKKVFSYQQIVLKFMEMQGFTMGMDDLVIPRKTQEEISRIVNAQELKSKLFSEEMSRSEVYPPMGISLNDFYEQQQLRKLSVDSSIFGPIISSIDQENNGLFQMIMYGGKGRITNMQSIFGYTGQLQVEGERMPPTFSPYRTSVYFPRYAMSPESKGFSKNSLSYGQDPIIMAFAGAEARQTIVQKSQSTAVSGSNQRKHIKNMENTIVENYRNVSKSHMNIQTLYGENGFDPRNLVRVKLEMVTMTIPEIKDKYYYKSSVKNLQNIFDDEINYIIDVYKKYHKIAYILQVNGLVNGFPNKVQFGVYIQTTIDNIMISKPKDDNELSEMVLIVKNYIDELPYLYINEYQRKIKGYVPKFLISACFFMKVLIISNLYARNMIKTNKKLLKFALDNISYKFITNLISPGSCVGVMAGQSVGEPLTQMMLDAVHGTSSGATAGLEKIKEILSAKYPSNSTNSMLIRLKDNISQNRVRVNNISESIKGVIFNDFIKSYQLFLEDYGNPIHPKYKHEKDMIEKFEKNNPSSTRIMKKLSRWVMRFHLDKKRLMYKSISVELLVEKLYSTNNNIYIVYTTELDNDIIIRIYIMESMFIKESNIQNFITNILYKNISNTLIRGVKDILDSKIQPYNEMVLDKDEESYIEQTKFLIKTTGLDVSNLISIADEVDIDVYKIQLGSVMDTLEYYGIEAARAKIIEQMMNVMEGKHPTYHHLSIYADILTWSGSFNPYRKSY